MATLIVGNVEADGQIYTGRCYFRGIAVNAAGLVTVYDNTAASGTIVWQGTGPVSFTMSPDDVFCNTGIYVDITGNKATVYYLAV